ncbi:hypothetical protein [Snuella sedimenti]|uniref:Uncharacterized protein n=1 Tax=Snuella sedimenti TaxID=2798802 RepID=A0A8J7IUK6_9FLAO|nr:hypothetical protein [Snuella sedimenti]MBJ6368315.1 hypothetical protein [Snuella sedimenti]
MKSLKYVALLVAFVFSSIICAQEAETSNELKATSETKVDKTSYYEKRALEDAKYEQQFKADNEEEELAFWEDQKTYEAELKARDRKAYRAYMRRKRKAYAEHYGHCDHHCHHSGHYYHHATFYYYGYNRYHYERYPRSSTTRVSIGTPKVRLGLF